VLPRLLRNLLDRVIQHAAFLSSRELLRSLSRPASSFDLAADRSNCARALDRENLGQMALPFLIQIGWLVLQWGRHHPLLSAYLCSLAGTSASVLSTTPASSSPPLVWSNEGHLAVLSRLA